MIDVTIPYKFSPRSYQVPFLQAMDSGKKRACWVVHRRGGKDKTAVNFTAKRAFQRVGTYYHCLPTYNQARKVLWDAIDKDGFRMMDHIPESVRAKTNQAEMKINLINGSVWQAIGADNYDAVVGANPIGLILSEWAVSDNYPKAWDYFRPILAENGGWAVFIYTPRGRNHGFQLYQDALRNPDWFCQLLTVDDTQAINPADIQAERDAGMSEDMIQQEFYCSFLASNEDIVIPFDWIQSAGARVLDCHRMPRYAGCDPARFGNDRTGFVVRQSAEISHIESWRNLDTVQVAGRLIDRYRIAKLYDVVAIDVIGLGAGIFDMVNNAGVPCIAVNVSESPSYAPERFVRLRDELWWKVREWFQSLACSISRSIPQAERDALCADIQDIHYTYTPVGKIAIESKDEMKERLKFSPDLGDALCCTFAPGIEHMIPEIMRTPFGMVNAVEEQYDALHFGLGRQ
jgi:hypothetical protein